METAIMILLALIVLPTALGILYWIIMFPLLIVGAAIHANGKKK